MEQMLKAHALQSLIKPVEMPDVSLGIGKDENHKSVPILVFTQQSPKIPLVEKLPVNMRNYEDSQVKGTGATISLADFETENFDIGLPY